MNPWGRQRTKNFSLASALWVMWGLLFSHLVAFKAPKSWPNKFLINVWGGFSVIFLASYTANIAALFAGVFSETAVTNFHDPRVSEHISISSAAAACLRTNFAAFLLFLLSSIGQRSLHTLWPLVTRLALIRPIRIAVYPSSS